MKAIEELKAAIQRLREAAKAEGIEAGSTLGIWVASQELAIMAMAETVEWQIERIEGRLDQVDEAMKATIARVDAEVGKLRAVTAAAQAQAAEARERTRESEEVRKVENLTLARTLGKEITATIKTTALAREVRFNRRQNWSAVALVAAVLSGVFIGGAAWSGYWSDHAILTKCLKAQQADATGKAYWCPMTVIRGAA